MPTEEVRHPWMYALGRHAMPARIRVGEREYEHARTFKHDFFAATGLYQAQSERIVLKIGRRVPLLGLPMRWLGRWLTRREIDHYLTAQDLDGVPAFLGRLGDTGFAHAFVPGHPLQPGEAVDDDFFQRLMAIVKGLHERGIAYGDLEKRENILVDDGGRPALIDFQISWHWPADRRLRKGASRWLPNFVGRRLLAHLCVADDYHLGKHRRRHRPDQLAVDELAATYRRPGGVRCFGLLLTPITWVRRKFLRLVTGKDRSPKQEGREFLDPLGREAEVSTEAGSQDRA